MKKIAFLFLTLISSLCLFAQAGDGLTEYSERMNDGDSIVTYDYIRHFDEVGLPKLTSKLRGNVISQFSSDALLKAVLEKSEFQSLCQLLGNYVDKSYFLTEPYFLDKDYIVSLFSNLAIRDHMFDILGRIVVETCKVLPSDYRDQLIERLQQWQTITHQMMLHTYSVRQKELLDGDKVNVVEVLLKDDQDADDDVVYGYEGVIARRVLYNNFTLEEIDQRLQTMLESLVGAKTLRAQHAIRVKINGDVQYFVTPSGNYFYFPKSDIYYTRSGFIRHQPTIHDGFKDVSTILCYSDGKNNYYRIYSGRWDFYHQSHFSYIDPATLVVVDALGNVIKWDAAFDLYVEPEVSLPAADELPVADELPAEE